VYRARPESSTATLPPHIKSMVEVHNYSTAPISTRGVASVHSEAAVASDWRKRPQTPSVVRTLPPPTLAHGELSSPSESLTLQSTRTQIDRNWNRWSTK
jgi:hypothetical protein